MWATQASATQQYAPGKCSQDNYEGRLGLWQPHVGVLAHSIDRFPPTLQVAWGAYRQQWYFNEWLLTSADEATKITAANMQSLSLLFISPIQKKPNPVYLSNPEGYYSGLHNYIMIYAGWRPQGDMKVVL